MGHGSRQQLFGGIKFFNRIFIVPNVSCKKFKNLTLCCLMVQVPKNFKIYLIIISNSWTSSDPRGAQEWHTVSLLGDVTSPTTVAHYISMTTDLRVLSTEKHWPPADSTRRTQTSVYSVRTKFRVCHWTSREVSLRHSSGWGTEAFPPQ